MANLYLNAVTEHLHLKGTVKPIAIALANRANDTGTCWPSVKTLSNDTGFSASTVKRSIHKLQESGYLTIEARTRKDGSQTSNFYTLIIESFTSTAKKAVKAVKQGFSKAVEMGKKFVDGKVNIIKPTSIRIGEQAYSELSEDEQAIVLHKLTSKNNETLQEQIKQFGLDSAYVQKAIFNEVAQLKRQKLVSGRTHKSIYEKLTDRSWDEGIDLDWEV